MTEADIKRLQQDISKLQASLDQYQGQRADIQRVLRDSEIKISKLSHSVTDIRSRMGHQQSKLDALQKRQKQLQTDSEQQSQLIARQIRVAYQLGRQKKMKVLLNQEDPAQLSRAITYLDYFNQARIRVMNDYADTMAELTQLTPTILQETELLRNEETALNVQLAQLNSEQQKREDAVTALSATIKDKSRQLADSRKERERLEKLLRAVEEAVANLQLPADAGSFVERRSKMSWPAKGRISHSFGSRKNTSGMRWDGVKLAAKEGQPVRTIHHGRVVFADWFRGSGMLVIVDHGDGYMSLYAHNQSLLKQTGEWVSTGEPIAKVGNSGGQDLAGLYFEIRHKGKPVNPKRWCK
ncbi:MAG: peptidoglycan DD-metalloendopeptidase family protein [Pseudomonadales bacterium]